MPVPHTLYDETGSVTIDESTCTACGECTRICPVEVLRLEDGRVRAYPESKFGCIACGHCMMVCPNGSVRVFGRGISPSDLVPLAPPEQRADWRSLANLMRSRRSVRRFTSQEPEMEVLQQIIAIAASGPMGIPPWDVGCVAIHGRKNVQTVAEAIVDGYAKLLQLVKPWVLPIMRLVMKETAYKQMSQFVLPLAKAYVEGRREGKDLLFYDAPALLIFHHSPYIDPSEAMIACTYAMLVAESMGLGTTMIGAAAPIMTRNPAMCRMVAIPEGNKPAIALIVGFPAVQFRRGVTRRFASVSTFE